MNCRICESSRISFVKYGATILCRCEDCGINFLSNFPIVSELDVYYKNDYKISGNNYETEHRRLSRVCEQHQLLSLIKLFKKDINSILDIGCDKGYFLDEARRFGIEVSGVELSQASREYCNRIGINVNNSIENIDKTFDVVIMNHSLEHFTEPKEILEKINLKLNQSGLIFVRVPAFDSFWAKLLKGGWIWFQPENHYFHYSLKSIKFLFENKGYEVLKVKHRKPNNLLILRFTSLNSKVLKRTGDYKFSLRKKIGLLVQYITGTEIIIVARKK